jgi:hypothetical protein
MPKPRHPNRSLSAPRLVSDLRRVSYLYDGLHYTHVLGNALLIPAAIGAGVRRWVAWAERGQAAGAKAARSLSYPTSAACAALYERLAA